jgi:CheY-like chemotaxis protein
VLSAARCTVASRSGTAAHPRKADAKRFDLILCDLLMPEMTGMDLHARLIRLAPVQALNVVFFTAAADIPDVRAFLHKVSNVVLQKPLEPATLRSFVTGWLRPPTW